MKTFKFLGTTLINKKCVFKKSKQFQFKEYRLKMLKFEKKIKKLKYFRLYFRLLFCIGSKRDHTRTYLEGVQEHFSK